ncbi:response regulator transcription factor [uncultured Thomasclavelia sp.]|uniref:response regulator transcription factor n=1 Tax=uncultured Thomasclavelia sp. TaxID=3025759 RepID=UPI0025E710EB|nr:response regulator transcription factor [uncultured Thomasclavelia sp.]
MAIALKIYESTSIDLMIVDVMMPKINGYELTEIIRKDNPNIPILMITAKETIEDKRKGFLSGVDDYMTKPIDYEEMVLRIKALLRRAKISTEKQIVIKNTTLDYDCLTVTTNNKIIELPKKEFLLLFHLLSYKGRIFTRRQLMENIWNMDSESDEHTIDVHINRLRNKFKDNPDFEIVTIRGLGYEAVEK